MTDWDVYEPQEMERDDSGSRTRGQTGRGQDGFSSKEASVFGFGGQHGPKASELGGEHEHDPMSCCFMSEEEGGMGSATNEYRKRDGDDDDHDG